MTNAVEILSHTRNPGYADLIHDFYGSLKWYYRSENWPANKPFFSSFTKINVEYSDAWWICFFGIVITIVRYIFEIFVCKPLVKLLKLNLKADRVKFAESFWKFGSYLVLWSYCSYLLVLSGKYNYFIEPWTIWDDWSLDMVVPNDIKWFYFFQCGYYLHSLYATIFMDAWRKDFMIMIVHHLVTMALIYFSYASRYYKIGICVLFVHDVTDFIFEFTKLNVYMKNRNKKYYAVNEYASNVGFVAFVAAWCLFRLYWFPLKVLYSAGVWSVIRAEHLLLHGFFNGLLWILMILNIYWFYLILNLLVKIATGNMKELSDTREDEDEDELKKTK